MHQLKTHPARRHIRFPPDPGATAKLVVDGTELVALIVDESKSGCQLMLPHGDFPIDPGYAYEVTVGRLPPTMARLVWVRDCEHVCLRVGLEYLPVSAPHLVTPSQG